MTLEQLKAKRTASYNAIAKLRDAFKANGSAWKNDEAAEWAKVNNEYDAAHDAIAVIQRGDDIHRQMTAPINPLNIGLDDAGGDHSRATARQGSLFRNAKTGEEIRALLPSEAMAKARRQEADDDGDDDRGDGQIRLGAIVAAMATNDRSILNRQEKNAVRIGQDDSGGYMIEPTFGTRIIDLARSASVAMKAGAQTLPMDSAELQLVQIAADPSAQWRRELVAVTSSTPSICKIVLRPKMLCCIVPLSIEIIEDSANIVSVIQDLMQKAMGMALDKAILMGAGDEAEPRGIINQGGIQTVPVGGTPTDYSKVSAAVKAILTANYPGDLRNLAWIQHPRDASTYDLLVDTTHQPLRPTPWAAQLQQLTTTSLPITGGGGTDGTSIVGDFSQVLVGMRSQGIMLQIFDAGGVSDAAGVETKAVSQYARFVRAYMRADVALMQPTWLASMTGIAP